MEAGVTAPAPKARAVRKPGSARVPGQGGGWLVLVVPSEPGAVAAIHGPFTRTDAKAAARAARREAREFVHAGRDAPAVFAVDRRQYFRQPTTRLVEHIYVLRRVPIAAAAGAVPVAQLRFQRRFVHVTEAGVATGSLTTSWLEVDRSYILVFGMREPGSREFFDAEVETDFRIDEARNKLYALQQADPQTFVKVYRVATAPGVGDVEEPWLEEVWPRSRTAVPCAEVAAEVADDVCDAAQAVRATLGKRRVANRFVQELHALAVAQRWAEVQDEPPDERPRKAEIAAEAWDEVLAALEDATQDEDILPQDLREAVAETLGIELPLLAVSGARANPGHRPLLLTVETGRQLHRRPQQWTAVALDAARKNLVQRGLLTSAGRLTPTGLRYQQRLTPDALRQSLTRVVRANAAEVIEERLREALCVRANRSGVPLSRRLSVVDADGRTRQVAEYRPKRVLPGGRTARPRIYVGVPTRAAASQFRELSEHVYERMARALEWDPKAQRWVHRADADYTTYIDPALGLGEEVVARGRVQRRAGPRGQAAARVAAQPVSRTPVVETRTSKRRAPKPVRGAATESAASSAVPSAPEAPKGRVRRRRAKELVALREQL